MNIRTSPLLLAGCILCFPCRSLARQTDSLDTAYDPDSLPSESMVESLTPSVTGGRLIWRSAWNRSSSSSGVSHGFRLVEEGKALSLRIAGDHDPGERVVTGPVPTLLDHVVVSSRWTPSRLLVVVAGAFKRSFFHGLTAGDERFGAPWSDANGASRAGSGIRSWAGAGEDLFLNGLAARFGGATLAVSGWASARRLDAAVDTTGSVPAARWSRGGHHATRLEKQRRDVVMYRELGATMEWSTGPLSAGAIYLNERFSLALCITECDDRGHFRRSVSAGSAWMAVSIPPVGFSIEARPSGTNVEVVAVGSARLRRIGSLEILVRKLGDRPPAILSGPPSIRGVSGREESGVLIHWRARLGRGVNLEVVADHSESSGDHFRGRARRVEHRVGLSAGRTSWTGSVTVRRSVRTQVDMPSATPGLHRTVRNQIRLTTGANIGRSLRLTMFAHRSGGASAMGPAIDWTMSGAWRIRSGLTEFSGAGGGVAIVTYEPDTPLAYPLRQLHGSGRRIWLLLVRKRAASTMSVSVGLGRRYPDGALEFDRHSVNLSLSVERRF